MKKKYLVTGGTGFIGAALVKRLVAEGQFIRILDNNSRGALSKLGETLKAVEFVEADIRDSQAVKKAAEGMDSVIHLAYVNGTEFFYKHPELVLDVGMRGMLAVLDACRVQGIKELIVASSSEVYHNPSIIPTDETVPLTIPDVSNPRYSYSGGKILSELMAIHYGRTGFERVLIFRPHNVYGPNMGFEHAIPQIVMRAKKEIQKNPAGPVRFVIQGDGLQTRAFTHIDDCIAGILITMEKGSHLNIYHIGNPEEVTIRQLTEKIFKILGREVELVAGPKPKGSPLRRCPDISKLKALGFQPKISLDEGLPNVVEWYMNRNTVPATDNRTPDLKVFYNGN